MRMKKARAAAAALLCAACLAQTAVPALAAEAYTAPDVTGKTLEQLMDEAMKLAEEIAAQAPIAVALCKEAINVGMQTDLNSALKLEGNIFGECFATEDQKYGMAYFLDKNKEKPAKEFKNK